jgi:hypothetical protein
MLIPVTPVEVASSTSRAEIRWGAVALSLGALLFVAGVILGLRAFSGSWDTSVGPTLPATAALLDARWPDFTRIWSGELIGAVLMAVGAFVLQRGPSSASGWVPVNFVWIVVAVGSLIVATSYAFVLGSYPPALAAFAEEPAVFGAIRGGTLRLHAAGSVLQLLGILTLLALEFRLRGKALPDRLVQAGALIAAGGIVLAAGGLMPGPLVAAAVFLAAALLGGALWTRAGRNPASAAAEAPSSSPR